MKKIIAVLTVLLMTGCLLQPVNATSHQFHELSMEIQLQEDGSAIIQETWDMTVAKGTENYKVFDNMEGASIADFSVADENGEYQYLTYWDIDASRSEKQGKCGIVKKENGYELCYGVGEYGHHTYIMTYTIHNFVDQYKDAQAINYQLVSSNMDPMPTKVNILVRGDMIDSNVQIYGFGYEGEVVFQDDPDASHQAIRLTNVKADGSVGRVNYVNLLAGFENHTFTSGNRQYQSQSFENVLTDAKKGSDYDSHGYQREDNSHFLTVMAIIVCVMLLIVMIPIIGVIISKRKRKYEFPKNLLFSDGHNQLPKKTEVDPFRDIPCHKDLFYFYYVALKANLIDDKEGRAGIIAAVLLKWIRDGNITFVKGEDKGFFTKHSTYQMDFKNNIQCDNKSENDLIEFFKEASGSNGILEEKEFEKWCQKNYTKMEAWFEKVNIYQENTLEAKKILIKQTQHRKILGIRFPVVKQIYSPAFREEMLHVAGFKKFLLEFSLIEEKQILDVKLWEEYLIFASILGIADKVEKELGRLYPEFNQQSNIDIMYTTMATRAFVYAGVRNSSVANSAAQMRSSGGGGFSSFGGGGGSFHGGGGGGTR